MEKKINKYESPLMDTVEIKSEGIVCASCTPVDSIGCSDSCVGTDCTDLVIGGGSSGGAR